MAAFASCRRSGAVRVMVLLLCALFIFATLGAPAAQALGVESVAVFGLASVLSAATAALGFKLASNEQGQATLQKMVQDFKTVAWATGFVLVGSKLNGLQNGMDYIKMQVQNGKTYLDSRVFAWVQQWLAENGVYGSDNPIIDTGILYSNSNLKSDYVSALQGMKKYNFNRFGLVADLSYMYRLVDMAKENPNYSDKSFFIFEIYCNNSSKIVYSVELRNLIDNQTFKINQIFEKDNCITGYWTGSNFSNYVRKYCVNVNSNGNVDSQFGYDGWELPQKSFTLTDNFDSKLVSSSLVLSDGVLNSTGLSGTDTLGKDVVDLTLDQILEKLKDWAQDWYDAGADSATNAATGAKDLPLTVPTRAATANPSIAEDGPLVWFPSFGLPIPSLRTGETDTNTVDQGKENANAADKTEPASGTVEETQTIVDSLLNWASDYISPDKGLFSKFPLCIPYDAYLLVCSALGVDALGVDDVVGSSPGDVQSVMGSGVEVYSNFQPVINFKHELKAGGTTYPIAFTLDLTPFEPIVKLNRIFVTVYVLAELIASEYKRIRSS